MRGPLASNAGLNAGPLYQQVTHRLLAQLAAGDFAPGQALPSERELALAYGVSIGTLRTAVDALVKDGILVRQQGRGTFVAMHDRDRLRFYFFHIVPHDREKHGYPDVRFASFYAGKADAVAAEKLGINRGVATFHICNVLWLDSQPVLVDEITVAAARFRGLTEAMVRERTSTLYNLYQANFGITVARSSERLRSQIVTPEHARLLQLNAGAPVLQIRRIALQYDGVPVEWRVSNVNTALHEYTAELGS